MLHLTVWSLRLFYILLMGLGLLIVMLPAGGNAALVGVPILLLVGFIERVVQGLLRLEKVAWWGALLLCVLLICSLWFTLFGLFGLLGLLTNRRRFGKIARDQNKQDKYLM